MSEVEYKTVYDLLSAMQRLMKVGKENRNEFGKYNYRNASDILEAAKPFLPQGATLTANDEIVLIGDRYYVKAIISLRHAGECVTASAYARESFDKKGMDDSQITGATSSYARKYALNALFSIDDTKDADSMDNSGHESKSKDDVKYAILVDKYADSILAIKTGIKDGDLSTASEAWFELSDEVKAELWKAPKNGGCFTTAERAIMKSQEFRTANTPEEK
jgi:hypothetical protein